MSPNPPISRQLIIKLARWVCVLLVILLVGRFVLHLVTTGTLTVKTGSNTANIVVSSPVIQNGPERGTAVTTKKGTGSLTIRLRAGTYIVSVQSGAFQTNQSVNVGDLSHKTVDLSSSAVNDAVEPVFYESVQNIMVDSSRMIYLSNDFSGIEYINDENEDTQINANQYFTSVDWADAQYGVAQNRSGQLYVIDGTSDHPLKSPISGKNDSSAAFAVAANRTIYIGLGSNVYRGTEGGGFKQIYSGFSSLDSLVAANDKVLVINPGRLSESGSATVINTNGQEVHKSFGYALSGWSPWSKGGKYIVISLNSKPELFNTSLNQVVTMPQDVVINNGAWLDDNTLFYYIAGQVWSYSLSQNKSELIATMPEQKLIQGISLSADGSYIYATVSSNNNVYPDAVFRVGLQGQQISSDISTLSDVLPINSSTYTIGLRNFSGPPVIEVTTYQGNSLSAAQQSAEQTIQGIININDVSFDVEPGD